MTRANQEVEKKEVGKRRKTARSRGGVALGDITNVTGQGTQQDDATKQGPIAQAPPAEQDVEVYADPQTQATLPDELANAPSFFRQWDQSTRDRAMVFFAQAASHYRGLGRPAQLDVKQEFGISDTQVAELCKYFGTAACDAEVRIGSKILLISNDMASMDVTTSGLDVEPLDEAAKGAASDPQAVAEYATKIFSRMRGTEVVDVPRCDYMQFQRDINGRMRSILVDWLVDVHLKYKLRSETLFLGVGLTDRYLARRPTSRGELQLVGAVGMLVAAKFEEIHPPEVADFRYITANAYSVEEIMKMECKLLNALEFQLAFPTVSHFLTRFVDVSQCSVLRREMAQYLTELALLDVKVLRFAPSLIAVTALQLSGEHLGERTALPLEVVQEAQHEESALRDCAAWLRGLVQAAPTAAEQAVRRKYAKPCHSCVADMVS